MTEQVLDPEYWNKRIQKCAGDLQRAQFDGSADQFSDAHKIHMALVQKAGIKPNDRILDVGCGYGRLLTLLPPEWDGMYVGVDLSPSFIKIARVLYPKHGFMVSDARQELPFANRQFDWAISVWVKTMMVNNGYQSEWEKIEKEMVRVSKKQLFVW